MVNANIEFTTLGDTILSMTIPKETSLIWERAEPTWEIFEARSSDDYLRGDLLIGWFSSTPNMNRTFFIVKDKHDWLLFRIANGIIDYKSVKVDLV
jgi:hypothetical protein